MCWGSNPPCPPRCGGCSGECSSRWVWFPSWFLTSFLVAAFASLGSLGGRLRFAWLVGVGLRLFFGWVVASRAGVVVSFWVFFFLFLCVFFLFLVVGRALFGVVGVTCFFVFAGCGVGVGGCSWGAGVLYRCRRCAVPSSSGLGRRPLKAVARVQIPSGLQGRGVPVRECADRGFSHLRRCRDFRQNPCGAVVAVPSGPDGVSGPDRPALRSRVREMGLSRAFLDWSSGLRIG